MSRHSIFTSVLFVLLLLSTISSAQQSKQWSVCSLTRCLCACRRANAAGKPPASNDSICVGANFSGVSSILPENTRSKNFERDRRSISLAANGYNSNDSTRPANDSMIRGIVKMLADPVSKNLPGRRSASTDCLIGNRSSGAR